jgi:hypothetical protein
VSYPGLIAQADHPQAGGEEFLDQIVLFDVERRAAEVGDAGGMAVALVEGAVSPAPRA